jgi:hypothetical protein
MELFNDTISRQDDPKLGMADCKERKKFICEVNSDLKLLVIQFFAFINKAYDFADDIVTPLLNECSEIYSLSGIF